MFKTLTKPPFSIKSLALNRCEFRLIHTWYTQQRKADQGHHNRLQQVFYNETKSKQLLTLSTSTILIRATPIQYFGTSSSVQTSSKRKMVNKKNTQNCLVGRTCFLFVLILSNRQQFDSLLRVKGFQCELVSAIMFERLF